MLRTISGLIIVAAGTIIGLSIYLQPNDFSAFCSDRRTNSACDISQVDAIVAISGGDTQARTNEAIKLYKNGWASKLIFSGAAEDKSGPSNAAAMKAIAVADGVIETDILIDEYSSNTKQNAENVQAIFTDNNIKNVILVTSGYHQRRASLEFNKRAVGVTIVNHPVASDSDWSALWFMTPRGWILALSEIMKIGIFYLTGFIA